MNERRKKEFLQRTSALALPRSSSFLSPARGVSAIFFFFFFSFFCWCCCLRFSARRRRCGVHFVLLLLLLRDVPVAFFCPTRSTKKIFPLLPKKKSPICLGCGKLMREALFCASLLCCFLPSFSSLTRFLLPRTKKRGIFPKSKFKVQFVFFVSFFPSHDSLVFVSYETRTLKKCVVCSNREWRESSLLVCFFISSFPTSETTKHVEERPKQIHPSTHTSIIIIIVYTHIEEEEDISSSSSWRWYHHHRRRA